MRAQAHSLEGIVSALVLTTGLVFALQVTAVTPLSASTSNQFIENQQQQASTGVLAASAATGELKPAVLFWNNSTTQFHGVDTDLGYYASGGPPNGFGQSLNDTFDPPGVAFNVYLVYSDDTGRLRRLPMVYRGEPSDNAVTASRIVTLYDDDELYRANSTASGVELQNSTYAIPDASPATGVYSVVTVEVVVWRM